MLNEYIQTIEALDRDQKLSFYESLAHLLTVYIRAIQSDEDLEDHEKLEAIKWMNEIMHSVTAKITVERTNSHDWSESDFLNMVTEYCDKNAVTKHYVEYSYSDLLKSIK